MERIEYEKIKLQQDVHWWFVAKREIVLALWRYFCQPDSTARVLDAGCGYGFLMEHLKKTAKNVYGFDISEEAVQWCREHVCPHVASGSLPDHFPFDEKFHSIFALDVLEHIADDCSALGVLYDHLQPGGYLIATVPASMNLWSYNDVVCMHKRRYDAKELCEKTKAAGYQILKLSYYNSLLFLPVYMVRKFKNFFHIQSDDLPAEIHDNWLNRFLYKIFSSEKEHLLHGTYPFGVSLIMVAQKQSGNMSTP